MCICDKKFEDRKPKSTYRLSPAGRVALEEYLETLSSLLPDRAQVQKLATAGAAHRHTIRSLPTAECFAIPGERMRGESLY